MIIIQVNMWARNGLIKTAEENYNKCDELIKMIDKKLANL